MGPSLATATLTVMADVRIKLFRYGRNTAHGKANCLFYHSKISFLKVFGVGACRADLDYNRCPRKPGIQTTATATRAAMAQFHGRQHQDPRRNRQECGSRAARRRGARLHRAARQGRHHHRRARPPVPRLHGQRAGDDAGAAQLRAARLPPYPKSICTSVNHVVCHGVPGDKKLQDGDIVNIDVTVIKDGFHGDTSRMFYVGEPSIQARRLCEVTYECMWRGIARGAARRAPRRHRRTRSRAMPRATATAWCANSAATASAGSSTRSRRSCTTAGRAPACGWSRA